METITAGLTVRVVEPLTPEELAAMVVAPVESVCARPLEGLVMLIVATPGLEEVQFTVLVRSWMEPSANVPVAVNCCVSPSGTDGRAGVTAMDTSGEGVTVSPVEPETEPDTAVMVVDPGATAIACPEASIVATAVFEELQFALALRSWVLPSE
jgi:hypothetical protein